MASLYVLIATVGRPELTRQTTDMLADQTRPPDGVVVVSVDPSDVEGVAGGRASPVVLFSEKGSCRQRNVGLDWIADKADIVTFFDDDFVPAPAYLAQVEKIFAENPDVIGLTGELIADGAHSAGLSLAEGRALIDAASFDAAAPLHNRDALYGCNMSVRLEKARDLRFDEALPLYGWQEDIDYSRRLASRGLLVGTRRTTGVHLGTRGGRTSGKRFGYSQVANLIYLWRKGTMQPALGERLLVQNLASNFIRSFWPEPHIDRRGRLRGNLLALSDLVRGRLDPRRIERM
jgi:GT2 family glycosyltransferase